MVISPDLRRLLPTLNFQDQWGMVMAQPWETSKGMSNLYRVLLGFDVKRLSQRAADNWKDWMDAHILGARLVLYRGQREEVQYCAEVLRPRAFYDNIVIPHRHYFEAHKQLKFWRDTLAKAEGLNGPPID